MSAYCSECGRVAKTGTDELGGPGAAYCPDHPAAVCVSPVRGRPKTIAARVLVRLTAREVAVVDRERGARSRGAYLRSLIRLD